MSISELAQKPFHVEGHKQCAQGYPACLLLLVMDMVVRWSLGETTLQREDRSGCASTGHFTGH